MNYKIEKPKDAPDWFTPGIVCKVWDEDGYKITPVLWFYSKHSERPYMDTFLAGWPNAKPVERWVPEDKEAVVSVFRAWTDEMFPFIEPFSEVGLDFNVYRYTDEVHEAIKAGKLTVGWLREHGEKYEPR